MKKYIITVLLLLSIIFLQGCSTKTMTNTLFDINSEYDNDGAQNTIKQSRIMTINPLTSIEEVGQVCFLDPKRGSETAIYLDININAKKVIKKYDSNTTWDDLINIRDKLLFLDRQTISLVSKNIELLNYKIYKKSNEYDKSIDDINNNFTNKIYNLENNITKISNDLNITYSGLIDDLNRSNAVIFRWSKEKEKSLGGKILEFFNINTNKKKSLSGFVLASGLTTEKIILSKNSIKSLNNNISEFFKPTTGIITYTLSAKDMIFVNKSDISTMFGMDLELEYDDFIGNSADILQKIDKLKLHIASTSVENGLSGGYLSNPTITKEDIILNSSENKNCTKDKESCSSSVFFAVYTKISELGRLFK